MTMHHTRRKSGHISANTSMTDVRKAVTVSDLSRSKRPQALTRKSTPQTAQKLGKNPRDREKEWQEERWFEDERESFPQYCMTCDKQFIPHDGESLFCSEACRRHDQRSSMVSLSAYAPSTSNESLGMNVPFYAAGNPEPRDIIPRASPSRPDSTGFSPPITPTDTQYTSAILALRSLNMRPPSPPSPNVTNNSIWPFARSANNSPTSSLTRPTSYFSSTYDAGYGVSGYAHGYTPGAVYQDRPLPSRKPGYGRPKSIELVTPMVGR